MSSNNSTPDNQDSSPNIELQYAPAQSIEAVKLYKLAKYFNIMNMAAIILLATLLIYILIMLDRVKASYSPASLILPIPEHIEEMLSLIFTIILACCIPTAFVSSIIVLRQMNVHPLLIALNSSSILFMPCIYIVPPMILPCLLARAHLSNKGVKAGIFGVSSSKMLELKHQRVIYEHE